MQQRDPPKNSIKLRRSDTHGTRLIDLDRGETDIYKNFADNGTLEEELKLAVQYRNQPEPATSTKPWWKFW